MSDDERDRSQGGKEPAPGELGDHEDVGERGLGSKTGAVGGGDNPDSAPGSKGPNPNDTRVS
jgi:hypothetical protein